MSDVYVGVDFGTCNLKTMFYRNDKAKILKLNKDIHDRYGQIPNVIRYEKKDGEAIQKTIGRNALKDNDFPNMVRFIKQKLQKKSWSKFISNLGRDVDADEVTKDIFGKISDTVNETFSSDNVHVAITTPVCFTELQKRRIRDAAKAAGLNVETVVSESFAAIFSQESLLEEEDAITLIFDFGGATLDVSLVRTSNVDDKITVEELSSVGIKYGGTDVDKGILENIFKIKYKSELECIHDEIVNKFQDKGDALSIYNNFILNVISNMKEKLYESDDEEFEDSIQAYSSKFYEFKLTRDEVTSMLEKTDIKERIIDMLDDVFSGNVGSDEVTNIRLFGGTSHIDYFQNVLTEYFGEDVFDADDFEVDDLDETNNLRTSVATGAARYVKEIEDGDIEIINRIPFHIGVKQRNKFRRIIDRDRVWGNDKGRSEKLDPKEIKADGGKVMVYQSFANFPHESSLNEEDGIIFMDEIELDEKLYNQDKPIFVKTFINKKGKLEFHFSQMQKDDDGDRDLVELEVKCVALGG